MIIRVENIDEMIEDLCCVFDIESEELKNIMMEDLDDSGENDGNIYRLLDRKEEYHIDEIYICHLTRQLYEPQELMNLKELLTGENKFVEFLKRYKLTFKKNGDSISIIYDGREINNLYEYNNSKYCIPRLRQRLDNSDNGDYYINGHAFAINPKKSMNTYYQHLMGGPEILQDLDCFFNTNMCRAYREKSLYYISFARVSLNDVEFYQCSNVYSSDEKEKKYLAFCLKVLLEYYKYNDVTYNELLEVRTSDVITVEYNTVLKTIY